MLLHHTLARISLAFAVYLGCLAPSNSTVTTVPVLLYNDCCEGAGASFTNKYELSNALSLYVSNESQAVVTYGKINCWGVGQVTDFSGLFYDNKLFNEQIGCWNVSSATDMSFMFYDAETFNQNISNWNVTSVQSMTYMFYGASAFNQSLCSWYDKAGNFNDYPPSEAHGTFGSSLYVNSMFVGSGCSLRFDPSFFSKVSFCQKCATSGTKTGKFFANFIVHYVFL